MAETLEEIEAKEKETEARRKAAEIILAGQQSRDPGYTPAGREMQSFSRDPAASPSAPSKPLTETPYVKGHIEGAKAIAKGLANTIPGAGFAVSAATRPAQPEPPSGERHPDETPPSMPEPTPPEDDGGPGIAGAPAFGGPQMATPAGMYPDKLEIESKGGKPVYPEVYEAHNAADALKLQAARGQRDASKTLAQHQRDMAQASLQATDEARTAHQRLQVERDAEVKSRLARIEQLNAQAAQKPEDVWNDRVALGQMLSAIAIGVGLASRNPAIATAGIVSGRTMEGFVNQSIAANLRKREAAGAAAAREKDLFSLHMDDLQSRSRAVDATKLAHFDSILHQMEIYKADHAEQVSEPAFLKLQAEVLERRGELLNKLHAQETDETTRKYAEKYHMATYRGGAGGAGIPEGFATVVVPAADESSERPVVVAVPKDVHKDLAGRIGGAATIIDMNRDALQRIQSIKKDMAIVKGGGGDRVEALKRIQANRKVLDDLAQGKASYLSTTEGQGVLREPEFKRAMTDRVHFTDWWQPGFEKRVQAQSNALARGAGKAVSGAGGYVVTDTYGRDRQGNVRPGIQFTGQRYAPAPAPPEQGEVK